MGSSAFLHDLMAKAEAILPRRAAVRLDEAISTLARIRAARHGGLAIGVYEYGAGGEADDEGATRIGDAILVDLATGRDREEVAIVLLRRRPKGAAEGEGARGKAGRG